MCVCHSGGEGIDSDKQYEITNQERSMMGTVSLTQFRAVRKLKICNVWLDYTPLFVQDQYGKHVLYTAKSWLRT